MGNGLAYARPLAEGETLTANRELLAADEFGPPDLDVLREIHGGDAARFEVLVRRYQSRVVALCHSMLGNRQEAEEAGQEVFVKAFQALPKFKGASTFYTWIYRIATNHCLDLLRKRKGRSTVSLDALVEDLGDRAVGQLLAEEDSGWKLEADDFREKVLAELPPEYRSVLTLREGEGFSYEEICKITGWSLDSVKARLRRARVAVLVLARHFSDRATVKDGRE